ncbi:AI-2E family transporter [Sulfurimonas sp.]|uniref:AI-2E family transporter n=1 Tax=Sulfurimonas sp. TaxID=2022749 RepID=UPI0025E2739A|nr:AI-2E family transporter [Sulfurimonas sp.]MDD5158145.1 AI-2E family transporter [Sulfurimonas sp.]
MQNNTFARAIIFGTLVLLFWLFFPFLKSFFVALLLMAAFTPVHLALELRLKKYSKISPYAQVITAGIMSFILISVLFVPIIFFAYYIITHPTELYEIAKTFYAQGSKIISLVPDSFSWLAKPLEMLNQKITNNQEQIISETVIRVGNGLLSFMGALGEMTMITIFFFFLSWYKRRITLAIVPVIPLKRPILREFSVDMISTISAGFYTLIGVAVIQGVAFGIFIGFFNGYNPLLLGLMIAVSSIIPIVGTALIWIPIVLNEFFNGHGMNALIVLIYSWAMLSFFIDNIVRLIILQQINKLLTHGGKRIDDFLIFFAILAGLTTFGLWGFIIGPAIVAFSTTLLRVLRHNHRVS